MGSAAPKPKPRKSRRSGKKSAKLYQANIEILRKIARELKEK